jgi:hypothetical protein
MSNHGRERRPAILALVGFSVVILIAMAVFVVPALMVPASQVPDAARRLEVQNSIRATLLQGLGATFLIAGAYFTWRQIQLQREQLRQSLDSSTAQLQLSREGQITEQFSRALEHLGHDKPGVRVGAIYALEQIAKTSPEMRPAIHELLADYVRTESTWSHHDTVTLIAIEPETTPDLHHEVPRLLRLRAPDIQAAMTTLGRRIEVPDEVLELQDVDLRLVYLGNANLRRAILSRAMLTRAYLGEADLSAAHLRRTNFRFANLRKAILRDAELQDTILCGADLSGADLSNADLHNATFDNATIWPDGFDWRSSGMRHEAGLLPD